MGKIVLQAHISLDGFVAGVNGELSDFDAGEENLQFVCSLTKNSDTALFGRTSYELLESNWPTAAERPNATKGEIEYSSWYNSARKIVVSKTMATENLRNTVVIGENILDEIIKLKKQTNKEIIIFGSPSLSQLLMRHNLIDSYWIFVNPSVFGKGIPLFSQLPKKIELKLLTTKKFSNGEIVLNYVVER